MIELPETMTGRQAAFLKKLADARGRLLGAIAGLDAGVLCSEPVVDGWTVKDIFGHIVSWNEEFRADICSIRQGGHPGAERRISGEDDFAAWNRRWIAYKSDWTWERILADFERDLDEAVRLFLSLEPQDFRKRGVTPWQPDAGADSIATLANYQWRHMNQHARMIEKWRTQRGEN